MIVEVSESSLGYISQVHQRTMVFQMARPQSRSGTSNAQFVKRVPADLVRRGVAVGVVCAVEFPSSRTSPAHNVNIRMTAKLVKFSLGTADLATVATRQALAIAHVTGLFAALRAGTTALTWEQTRGLAGEVYRSFVTRHRAEPGSPQAWTAIKGMDRAIIEGRHVDPAHVAALVLDERPGHNAILAALAAFGDDLTAGIDAIPGSERPDLRALNVRYGGLADHVLALHGLLIDAASRDRLLIEVGHAAIDAARRLKRFAARDYRPCETAEMYPLSDISACGTNLAT